MTAIGEGAKKVGEMSVENWLELMQSFTTDSARDLAIAKRLIDELARANTWIAASSTILALLTATRIWSLRK